MTGSWTSVVSAAWAALGSGGVVVGRSRVDMRRCVTGVLGWVLIDSGGLKTSFAFTETMLGKSGWMLGGAGSSGEGDLIIAALTMLAMTISTAKLCSEVEGDGSWSSFISSGAIELSGDSVVVSEYDPLTIALATSRSVDESREGIVVWGVGRWVVTERTDTSLRFIHSPAPTLLGLRL